METEQKTHFSLAELIDKNNPEVMKHYDFFEKNVGKFVIEETADGFKYKDGRVNFKVEKTPDGYSFTWLREYLEVGSIRESEPTVDKLYLVFKNGVQNYWKGVLQLKEPVKLEKLEEKFKTLDKKHLRYESP